MTDLTDILAGMMAKHVDAASQKEFSTKGITGLHAEAVEPAFRELVEALTSARKIIADHVPADALGIGTEGGGDGFNDRSWPILDEYLHYMSQTLSKYTKESGT